MRTGFSARLRTLRSDLIDPIIAVHHGRVVKRTGDGAIVEFRSVVDAVNCAIEVQRAMVERNAEVAPDKRIEFRIGIHLGDVVEESDGDLMGDGVNIAARLQGVAKPGGICLSEDAYRQVKARLDLAVSDLGPMQLKNIAEPMRAYSLEVGAPREARSPPPADQAKQRASKRRWASAPFAAAIAAVVLLTASAAGMSSTDAWRNRRRPRTFRWWCCPSPTSPAIRGRIISPTASPRTSPPSCRASTTVSSSPATPPSPLRAEMSTPRRSARSSASATCSKARFNGTQNRVRVNAQLVDAVSGAHLWGDRFEEDLADTFYLQDQVVARLANALGYELIRAEAAKGARSKDPDTMDLAMRGRALPARQPPTKDDNRAARAFFEQALQNGPQ